MKASDDIIQVWRASLADPLLAGHDVIAIVDPQASYTMVLETAGWEAASPVDAVLSTTGFVGRAGPRLSVREVPCSVPVDLQIGFAMPRANKGQVLQRIERALRGELSGFWPVVASQAYFHGSTQAFEHAWSEAGHPPIIVRHPSALSTGTRRDDGTPGSIALASQSDERVLAMLERERAVDDTPEEERLFITDRQDM